MLSLEAFYRNFANRREVAAYSGLTPSPWKSGGIDVEQGISKAGNARLRKTVIQLAWLWLRHQPGSALSRWFYERVGDRRGKIRRIADRRTGAQATGGTLALRDARPSARGCRAQGMNHP